MSAKYLLPPSTLALIDHASNGRKFVGNACVVECSLKPPFRPGTPTGIVVKRYASDEAAVASEPDDRTHLASVGFILSQEPRGVTLSSTVVAVKVLGRNTSLSGRNDEPGSYEASEFAGFLATYLDHL